MYELILFGAGALTGAGAMYAHALTVRRAARTERDRGEHAVAVARGENVRLNDRVTAYAVQIERDRLATAVDNAYKDGFKAGRKSPESAAEQFAHSFERHRGQVVFKVFKG